MYIVNLGNESRAFVVTEVEYPSFPDLFVYVCLREREAGSPT